MSLDILALSKYLLYHPLGVFEFFFYLILLTSFPHPHSPHNSHPMTLVFNMYHLPTLIPCLWIHWLYQNIYCTIPSSSSFPHRHLPSFIVIFLPSSSSSFLVWVDLVSPSMLNFGVQHVLFTDSGVSNICDLNSTCNTWFKDNTLHGIFVPLSELKLYCLQIHLAIVTIS